MVKERAVIAKPGRVITGFYGAQVRTISVIN